MDESLNCAQSHRLQTVKKIRTSTGGMNDHFLCWCFVFVFSRSAGNFTLSLSSSFFIFVNEWNLLFM